MGNRREFVVALIAAGGVETTAGRALIDGNTVQLRALYAPEGRIGFANPALIATMPQALIDDPSFPVLDFLARETAQRIAEDALEDEPFGNALAAALRKALAR